MTNTQIRYISLSLYYCTETDVFTPSPGRLVTRHEIQEYFWFGRQHEVFIALRRKLETKASTLGVFQPACIKMLVLQQHDQSTFHSKIQH